LFGKYGEPVLMGPLAFNLFDAHTLIVHATNQSIQWWRPCRGVPAPGFGLSSIRGPVVNAYAFNQNAEVGHFASQARLAHE
jgi:hypothetical protein